ncbi:MAG: DUF2953 domain-containing protein [Clostridia bacterium]|nr:DUF2953 domain-containing protein [Clostridia bacterium]
MVLVFILLGIVILLTLLTILLISSTINIKVKNMASSNIKRIDNQSMKIIISLKAFDKITWFFISFNQEKLSKMQQKMKGRKIDINKLQEKFHWSDLKELKKLQVKIAKLNLLLKLGTENAVITAYVIGTLASIISILLPHMSVSRKQKDYYYQLIPLYENQNVYEIQFDCIIQVKMVHIINTIYSFVKKKKRRSDLNERTSNRGAYDYSHG